MRIERAVREKTFTLTSIAGPSGSGKTYSAILYARGLVGEAGKIGFIDTENKRSRFYAEVGGGFDVIDLDPPFTSARYIEAITALQDAGYTAIIIDSISHEWEGTGGVLEQAEAIEDATKKSGLHCWKKPKAAHKRLMNELLQTKAHLIFCCRVKEKVEQVKNGGRTEIVNQGFVVVQEKSFIYEMTVSMMLEEGTHVPIMQKCPDDLLYAFPPGQKISQQHGNGVRMWSDKGATIDPAFKAARLAGLEAANKGTAALTAWWKGLGGARQKEFESLKETFKSIANARDLMAAELDEHSEKPFEDRLGAAMAGAQTGEGFDAGSVARQTAALADEPAIEHETLSEPSSEPRSPAPDDAGDVATARGTVADEPAAGGMEERADPDSPPADPGTRNKMEECRDKFLAIAANKDLDDDGKRATARVALDAWKAELPAHGGFVKACLEALGRIVKGGEAASERTYLDGLIERAVQ